MKGIFSSRRVMGALVVSVGSVTSSWALAEEAADRVRINGMQMSIRTFTRDGNVEAVSEEWLVRTRTEGSSNVQVSTVGDRVIIGRLVGGRSETVTIRPSLDPRRSQVIVAHHDPRVPHRPLPNPPVLLSFRHAVVSVVEWMAAGSPTLFQIHTPLRAEESRRSLEERLRRDGWRLERINSKGEVGDGEGAVWAFRGSEYVAVVVTSAGKGGSRLLMQWSTTHVGT